MDEAPQPQAPKPTRFVSRVVTKLYSLSQHLRGRAIHRERRQRRIDLLRATMTMRRQPDSPLTWDVLRMAADNQTILNNEDAGQ